MLALRLTSLLFAAGVVTAIWPRPQHLSEGTTPLLLSPAFQIQFAAGPIPHDVDKVRERAERSLLSLSLRHLSVDEGRELLTRAASTVHSLQVELVSAAWTSLLEDVTADHFRPSDESYELDLRSNGLPTLRVNSTLGLLRGLTTWEQLWYAIPAREPGHSFPQTTLGSLPFAFTPTAPYAIRDYPHFYWRGLMVDTSRHFVPKHLLKSTIDGMMMAKLNKLHWHITDSQSWPLALSALPELARQGAYSRAERYSEEDLTEIITYAAQRGVDVVLEIDVPGHTASIGLSHPDLVACMYAEPWRSYAVEPPAGQLRFMLPEAQSLMTGVFQAVRKRIRSSYIGTGGDEINLACYEDDPVARPALGGLSVQEGLRKFVQDLHLAIAPLHPLVWEETALASNISLPDGAVAIAWKDAISAARIAELGHHVLQAPSDTMYLDCGQGSWLPTTGGSPSWCSYNSWDHIYSLNPYANISDDRKRFVLGGETALWTEQTDATNFAAKIWPRAAAAAEVFWTANGISERGYPMDPQRALGRLQEFRYRLVEKGIQASPLQPHWCALRPGACV